MRFKNVKKRFNELFISCIILSLFAFTACGDDGNSDDGGDDGTPNYSNSGLPLTEAQDWLIMYYCDADNDLEEFIMNDLNEMESVDLSGKKIKIVALVDRNASYYTGSDNWSDSRVYEVEFDSSGYINKSIVSKRIAVESLGISNNTSGAEVNMGDGDTLTKFIEFCIENYPANKRMLLFTNHGGGWRDNPAAKKIRLESIGVTKAVCWDETDGNATLYTSELSAAVASAMGTTKLDIIAFDACLMAMVEVAYELKDLSYYMVASQETIPGYGFPYTQILEALPSDLSTYDSISFGTKILDEYQTAYVFGNNVENIGETDESITLSLIDLSKISTLAAKINDLGAALDVANGSNPNMDARILSEFFANADYIDIEDYSTKESLCTTERTAVIAALGDAVVANYIGNDHPNANGLSIFMPVKWTGLGEQADYTATNIQFADSGAAPLWRTYLTTITNPDATDDNEIKEIAAGGGIYTTSTSIETGYIFYTGDQDIYEVSSDGTFRLSVTGGVAAEVDVFLVNNTTQDESYVGTLDSGYFADIPSYNPTTHTIYLIVSGSVSVTTPYTLTMTNI